MLSGACQGSHTLSNRGYSPDCHVDFHAMFYFKIILKKSSQRGGHRHP